jgi:RNA polymerase sigma factor (sigma-70 family)
MLRYAVAITRSRQLAEDAVSGAFESVIRRFVINEFEPKNLEAYVATAVRHEAGRLARRRSTGEVLIGFATELERLSSDTSAPRDLVELSDVLQGLPKRLFDALYCIEIAGMSYEEASRVLKVAKSTVHERHKAALRTLRSALVGLEGE